MRQSVVVRLADQHYLPGGFGEKLAPFQQALMSIKRIVSPTLNREYGSGKFVRQVQRADMVGQSLFRMAFRAKNVVNSAAVTGSKPLRQRCWLHHGLVLCSATLVASRYFTV